MSTGTPPRVGHCVHRICGTVAYRPKLKAASEMMKSISTSMTSITITHRAAILQPRHARREPSRAICSPIVSYRRGRH